MCLVIQREQATHHIGSGVPPVCLSQLNEVL